MLSSALTLPSLGRSPKRALRLRRHAYNAGYYQGCCAQAGYLRRLVIYCGIRHHIVPNVLDRQLTVAAPKMACVTGITDIRTHEGRRF